MMGITRVSKESVFSDLNNLTVVTTTSEKYASCFGFTQQEVTDALDEYGLEESSASVSGIMDLHLEVTVISITLGQSQIS